MNEANSSEFYALINHLMKSKGGCCYAPAKRYCPDGLKLKKEYEESLSNE